MLVTNSHVERLDVTDLKMCKWACGQILRYHMRNCYSLEGLMQRTSHRGTGKLQIGGVEKWRGNTNTGYYIRMTNTGGGDSWWEP